MQIAVEDLVNFVVFRVLFKSFYKINCTIFRSCELLNAHGL